MEEIAFVPLFVKPPRQSEGRIVRRARARHDILPTIADVLGVGSRGRRTGARSSPAAHATPTVRIGTSSGRDRGRRRRRPRSTGERTCWLAQIALFGEGDDVAGLFGIGPRPDLLGRQWTGSPRPRSGARPSRATARATTTPPRRSPRYGSTAGSTARPPGEDIAIAVNGRIVAVTRSFEHDGDTLVSAVTPEDAYRPGRTASRLRRGRDGQRHGAARARPPLDIDRRSAIHSTSAMRKPSKDERRHTVDTRGRAAPRAPRRRTGRLALRPDRRSRSPTVAARSGSRRPSSPRSAARRSRRSPGSSRAGARPASTRS